MGVRPYVTVCIVQHDIRPSVARVQVVAGLSGGKPSVSVQGTCAHASVCVSKCVLEQPPTSIAAGEATLLKSFDWRS